MKSALQTNQQSNVACRWSTSLQDSFAGIPISLEGKIRESPALSQFIK